VTAINGFVLLGVGAVVAPATELPDPAMAWVVAPAVGAGIAHLVAAVGLIRARAWARPLVGYLAAGGIGAAAFAVLMTWRAEEAMLGAAGSTAIGFYIWMIGSWLVAARFAFQAYARPATARVREATISLPTPRIVAPTTVAARAPCRSLVGAAA